jgi:hypothetical protein
MAHGSVMVEPLLSFMRDNVSSFPNLPVTKLAPGIMKFQAFFGTIDAQRSHTQQHEDNLLPPASQKLLHIHHRLGHKGFHYIQKWAAEGLHDMP